MTEESQDVLIFNSLKALGVSLVSEWDAFAFLYRHSASLGTAAQIARLIGYNKAEIGAAFSRLEALGLIQRSRVSQGMRLYQFSQPPEASRRSCIVVLMSSAENRAGRLLILKHLKPSAKNCQTSRVVVCIWLKRTS
jgi:DNA-binding MarR family transcriptional regulator